METEPKPPPTLEVCVCAQLGWIQEKLDEDIGGTDQHQTDPQQS